MTARDPEQAAVLAEMLLQISRVGQAGRGSDDLLPGQRAALRYFDRANALSRTVSAFARFQAATKGNASQTVKALIERGYLTRNRSDRDGRTARIDLTDKGRDALTHDPARHLIESIDALPNDLQSGLRQSLLRIARDFHDRAHHPLFGSCNHCTHLTVAAETVEAGETTEQADTAHDGAQSAGSPETTPCYRCQYAGQSLQPDDLGALCVGFDPCCDADAPAGDTAQKPLSSSSDPPDQAETLDKTGHHG